MLGQSAYEQVAKYRAKTCTIERVIKLKFPYIFLEPAYFVRYAYILTENFGFGKFF